MMVFCWVEVAPAVEYENELVGSRMGSVELYPRLISSGTVMSHPQVVAVEVVNRNHFVTHARKLCFHDRAPAPVSEKTNGWLGPVVLCVFFVVRRLVVGCLI